MHSNEINQIKQNAQAVKFYTCEEDVPTDKPFVLMGACDWDLRPNLKQHGAIGFMSIDDLGECEYHAFLLKNEVVYLVTNHLHLPAATVIEVNSTKRSIAHLLSDMFDWLGINPPKESVHEISHEFDVARRTRPHL